MVVAKHRPEDDVLFTPLGGGDAVLLDVTNRRFFTLNETGCFIWTRLREDVAHDEIARELTNEFDVARDAASSEVMRLVAELTRAGLLRAGAAADEGLGEARSQDVAVGK